MLLNDIISIGPNQIVPASLGQEDTDTYRGYKKRLYSKERPARTQESSSYLQAEEGVFRRQQKYSYPDIQLLAHRMRKQGLCCLNQTNQTETISSTLI